jgi:hypothetical protein
MEDDDISNDVASGKYILDGRKPVPEPDLFKWAKWFESSDRIVAKNRNLPGDATVSTVFLGLDHRFVKDGPPLLFETMIFGGRHDGLQWRYATYDEAKQGHIKALALAMEA